MGGTNCHVILEEAPPVNSFSPESGEHILALSAKSPEALQELVQRYHDYLEHHPDISLSDLCFTANTGRKHFEYRFAAIAGTVEALVEQLKSFDMSKVQKIYSVEGEIVTGIGESLSDLAKLYQKGAALDWQAFYRNKPLHRIPLPTYPFQRQRYWVDTDQAVLASAFRQDIESQTTFMIDERSKKQTVSTDINSPETELEQQLSEMVQAILQVDSVDIDTNFFELGVNSLKILQIQNQLQLLGQKVSIVTLFKYRTIRQLASHLKHSHQTISPLPQITPEPDERPSPFPLTDIQEAYWVGRTEVFELHTPTHSYEEFSAKGLEHSRLEIAWQRLIKRHEMLRAIILPSGQQKILTETPVYSIKYYDFTQADAATINSHLETVRQEMISQFFSAEQWPLFEIRVTQLGSQELRIHFSIDMLIADWGSYNILLQEWTQLYHQPEQPLPVISFSFRDYVLTESKIRETEPYKRAETYWQERLLNLPPAPELPLAVDPGSIQSAQFERHQALLTPEHWSQLKDKAVKHDLTPTCLLLTVFAEILTRWSKRPQLTLNLTLFNRLPLADQKQIDRIVGDFTSLTMLAVDNSDPTHTLAKRGKRLQDQLWLDLEHRYFTGVQVLRALAEQKGRIGQILMPIVFTSALGLSDGESDWFGESVYGLSQTSQVWLDNQIWESKGGLSIAWDVVVGLFPAGLIETMFSAYITLLRQLAVDETLWHATTFDLLPSAQQKQRQEINNTRSQISPELLHTLFIKQAIAHPQQFAVIDENRILTYDQLYQEATHIAQWLHTHGAGPNQLVAIVMDKGWEQVAAVIGILMSGAAYLPIDPELPVERQHHLLAQGEVQLVLTQPHLENQLTWPDMIQRLGVNQGNAEDLKDSSTLDISQSPTDLAYVIYTSGSTGQPKGVMIDHRGAVNTIIDINQRFGVTAKDRVLALSALNFDLSVYDIFGLLAAGGSIVIPSADRRRYPSHWVKLMTQHGVTLWNTVPALMQMFVDYLKGISLPTPLRLVMMSGDWIPLDLPERIRRLWPKATLMSLGGATEASIWSIYYPIDKIKPDWKSIPYGKPLTNQMFHVLNERLETCPTWVVGGLYIGGIGLAVGYWRNTEKTEAHFFIHPHTGERLYKTGDLGRYLADGNIEFLGREDFQVKIQGHRIELGEIESHILKHPQIKEAVVTAVGESHHDKQLTAYVVPTELSCSTKDNQAVDQAAYGLQIMQGVLTDPIERLQFKLNQPGIRQFETVQAAVVLPEAEVDNAAYLARQSYRQFLDEPITLKQLGPLLNCLSPRTFPNAVLPKYRYGSAGSLYPVQAYLYVKPNRITDLAEGLYYYHPLEHQLLLISSATAINREHHGGTNQDIFDQSAFSLFLVAEYKAIEPMYGASAHNFCLLEAGYISQLLMMEAPGYNIGLCPIGGMEFEPLKVEFGLGESQEMIHSFLGGGITPAQKEQLIVQSEPQTETLEERLKTYLSQKLPSYMVPVFYMSLPLLPLTPNGKVDRKALPHPKMNKSTRAFIQPRNKQEQRLVELVQKQLQLKSLSTIEDFFDLGANSLDMVQLFNEVKTLFQREITMRDLFNYTTVQSLAKFLDQAPVKGTIPDTPTNIDLTSALNPEQVDRLLDNMTEDEVEKLLAKLKQE
jgi:amino acid adenylation domain-containing protein